MLLNVEVAVIFLKLGLGLLHDTSCLKNSSNLRIILEHCSIISKLAMIHENTMI